MEAAPLALDPLVTSAIKPQQRPVLAGQKIKADAVAGVILGGCLSALTSAVEVVDGLLRSPTHADGWNEVPATSLPQFPRLRLGQKLHQAQAVAHG